MLALMSLVLVLPAQAAEPAEPPAIRLAAVASEGMSAADRSAIEARVGEELALMGAGVASGAPPAAGCLDDAACRSSLTQGAAGVLALELVRVGPILQVKARLFGPDGVERKAVARDVQIGGVSGSASLLGAEMAAEIRALLSAAAAPARAPEAPATEVTAPGESSVLPWVLAGSGLAVIAAGAAVSAAGAGLALWQTLAAYTPDTPGDQKGTALILAPAGAAAVAVGVVVIAVGGAVAVGALLLE